MSGAADILVPALALLGGGAVGAALGGAALFRTDWTGDRLRGAIAGCALIGSVLGLVASGVPMPALASLLPRFPSAPTQADGERILKTYYPDDYAQARSPKFGRRKQPRSAVRSPERVAGEMLQQPGKLNRRLVNRVFTNAGLEGPHVGRG